MPSDNHIWEYRGHRLQKMEWGLWTDLDEPERFFLCYRPEGRNGPVVRRWAIVDGKRLTVADLRHHVRTVNAERAARRVGLTPHTDARQSATAYGQDMERRNLSERHRDGVERSIRMFLDHAGVATLDGISSRHVQDWLWQMQQRGRSPRTLNKHRAHLSGWFSFAVTRGDMAEKPTDAIAPARQVHRLPRFPLPEEFSALVDASSPYDAALWSLLAFTGLRRGSLLSLSAESFRDHGILVPHTKRRREWWLGYDDGCPLWLPSLSEVGRAVWARRAPTPDYMRFHFGDAIEAVGLDCTMHGLRHGFISWLMMMGEPPRDVQAWAHHGNFSTTEKYAHLRPGGRARVEKNRESVFTMCSHAIKKALSLGTAKRP